MVRIHHIRSRVGDGPVEQPVAGSRHREALGTCLEWKHFAGHYPCDGPPRAGEEENVDAHKGDRSLLRSKVCVSRINRLVSSHTDSANDELANTHADGTHEKQVASPKLLNKVETGERRRNVDGVGNDLDDKRVFKPGILEVLRSVVDFIKVSDPKKRTKEGAVAYR